MGTSKVVNKLARATSKLVARNYILLSIDPVTIHEGINGNVVRTLKLNDKIKLDETSSTLREGDEEFNIWKKVCGNNNHWVKITNLIPL